jgi:hypothetical protein
MLAGRLTLGATALVICAGAAIATPPAPKGPLKDWPCAEARVDALSAETLYVKPLPGPLPPAGAWLSDSAAKSVVEYAAAPENNPDLGIERIKAFGQTANTRRPEELLLVLSGIVERTNVLRRIIIDGIGDKVVKSRLLAETVAQGERDIAAIPDDGTSAASEHKKGLETARYWNSRALGDTADDAELLCHRLAYTAKKAQRLVDAVRDQIERP